MMSLKLQTKTTKSSRTKVTRACDSCKKWKYKCTGTIPCRVCKKKNIRCQISHIDGRSLRGRRVGSNKEASIKEVGQRRVSGMADNAHIRKECQNSGAGDSASELTNLNTITKSTLKKLEHAQPNPKKFDGIPGSSFSTASKQNNNDTSIRILLDSVGNLRYVGESSPLSFLYDCRNVFREYLGPSEFTDDPQRSSIVDHIEISSQEHYDLQLPVKKMTYELLSLFETNINLTFHILDIAYFRKRIIDPVYDDPLKSVKKNISLIYLILSLGLLFKELSLNKEELQNSTVTSTTFFKRGYKLVRSSMDEGKLWISEAYFLIYFYYQSTSNRNMSWYALGNAIRNAQALGLHRKCINESFNDSNYSMHRRKLFRSLYICDRMSSILLGRPLMINDYDWDEFDMELVYNYGDYETACLMQNSKIANINGRIVQNFYVNGTIERGKAEVLASELKAWSTQLSQEIQIGLLLSKEGATNYPNSYPVFFLHLSQLYGIILLTKPFFVFCLRKQNSSNTNSSIQHFYSSCVKSSVLTIQLISIYLDTNKERVELYATANCCFIAALVLGSSLLHIHFCGYGSDYDETKLMEYLIRANKLLIYLKAYSIIADRFQSIVNYMIDAIELSSLVTEKDGIVRTNTEDKEIESLDYYEHPLSDYHLSEFQDFQQGFLSTDSLKEMDQSAIPTNPFSAFMYDFGVNDLLFN